MIDFAHKCIKKAAYQSYPTAKAYEYVRFALSRKKLQSVIVFQMGKVGSSTIVKSLSASEVDADIYQIHVLTPEWIARVDRVYREASRVYKRPVIDNHLIASLYLRRRLDRAVPGTKWQVVTLVRDPIARNISSFFESFSRYYPELHAAYKRNCVKMEDRVEELADVFLKHFNHDTPLIWFDTHLKPVFGLDVFSYDFSTAEGYQICSGETTDLLVIRQEDINRCAGKAFREFLGLEHFELVNANLSQNKVYDSAYRKFIRSVKLPADYLEKMYSSRYVRKFYTEDEIRTFRTKWTRTVGAERGPKPSLNAAASKIG